MASEKEIAGLFGDEEEEEDTAYDQEEVQYEEADPQDDEEYVDEEDERHNKQNDPDFGSPDERLAVAKEKLRGRYAELKHKKDSRTIKRLEDAPLPRSRSRSVTAASLKRKPAPSDSTPYPTKPTTPSKNMSTLPSPAKKAKPTPTTSSVPKGAKPAETAKSRLLAKLKKKSGGNGNSATKKAFVNRG